MKTPTRIAWQEKKSVSDGKRHSSESLIDLEFKDKGRLREFLARIHEHFPDSERKVNTIFSSEDFVICEWTLTATHTEPFLGGRSWRTPICVRGVSVVQIEHGKISQWSDYYDQLQSRRYRVAARFTDWVEV